MPTIEPADYWQLRAVTGDLLRLDAQLAILRERRERLWATLVEKYGLDATAAYTAGDHDCSLTATTPTG